MAEDAVQNGRQRLADRVRLGLEREIVTGDLTPGTRLDETRLAERYEVSRTPVREALMQLAASGLIEMRPRQGALVAAIGTFQLAEMFEVMSELEALCARLAARRMTPAERDDLAALHEACAPYLASGDADAYYELNLRFHEAIYAGSHNAFLEQETRKIRLRVSPYRRMQLHRPGRLADSHAEHGRVVAAILAGDQELAGRLLKDHVAIQSGTFVDFLATVGGLPDRRPGSARPGRAHPGSARPDQPPKTRHRTG
ncbi:DNA-binding transcriptional regulator, GntR family [Tistlia consotensis]|uniref:Transcriptional regulator, GntR family n=1 Tax=Tistlia consotensis USBA 355 TaxID=560819 RepID=A0A1Y6C3Q0_9PROT|nr:GntR family transcriptional regulator [Tistlia consotensis]SMF43959.1 transcriptional regulator, GntR family [Tistlia consotensis USBA 355]SNR42982.1 DNA-binding transcriptional regulator, GntR family [Tistlia consotensis]